MQTHEPAPYTEQDAARDDRAFEEACSRQDYGESRPHRPDAGERQADMSTHPALNQRPNDHDRSGLTRELRNAVRQAAAAANAWLRGMPLPVVAILYRYEPITALHMIARLAAQHGEQALTPHVPPAILSMATAHNPGFRASRAPHPASVTIDRKADE